MTITDFDGWMYRNWWYYLSQKNGWATGSSSSNSASPVSSTKPSATAKAATTKAAAAKPTTTTKAAAVKTTAAVKPSATSASSGSGAAVSAYGQCGGNAWTGSTKCASGLKCIKHNDYYSQCVPA